MLKTDCKLCFVRWIFSVLAEILIKAYFAKGAGRKKVEKNPKPPRRTDTITNGL